MTHNHVITIILLFVFASCHSAMGKIPVAFEDSVYVVLFVVASLCAAGILYMVKE